jgi:hypothetical protein
VLAGAPAALDLFMWLSYRCFVATGQGSIPLFGERGLANQLGSIEYSRPRRFCQKLEQWLKMIRLLWPDCPAQIKQRWRRSPGQSWFCHSIHRKDWSMKATAQKAPSKRGSKSESFALEIRVRGKADALHRESCQGLEDAVRIGEKWFRAFSGSESVVRAGHRPKEDHHSSRSRNSKPHKKMN